MREDVEIIALHSSKYPLPRLKPIHSLVRIASRLTILLQLFRIFLHSAVSGTIANGRTHDVGIHNPRAKHGGTNIGIPEFRTKRLHHTHYGILGRRVRRRERESEQTHYR